MIYYRSSSLHLFNNILQTLETDDQRHSNACLVSKPFLLIAYTIISSANVYIRCIAYTYTCCHLPIIRGSAQRRAGVSATNTSPTLECDQQRQPNACLVTNAFFLAYTIISSANLLHKRCIAYTYTCCLLPVRGSAQRQAGVLLRRTPHLPTANATNGSQALAWWSQCILSCLHNH